MPLRGVIFDFDGVIADTEPLHLRAFQAVLAGGPMSLSKDVYLARYLGFDDAGLFRAVAKDRDVALVPSEVSRLVEAKGRRYAELVEGGNVVFPEARTCIERLSESGVVLGVASGALHHEIETILRAAGLRRHFTAIVAADDVARAKPAPDVYSRAVELMSAAIGRPPSPAGFVAIEDSRWGIESAHAAGLPCVGVTTSYGADALPGAALVVQSLEGVDRDTLATLTEA